MESVWVVWSDDQWSERGGCKVVWWDVAVLCGVVWQCSGLQSGVV